MNRISRQSLFYLILILVGSLLSSCVSVNLPSQGPERSKVYKFSDPKSPFEVIQLTQVDRAWRNKSTGNAISILSDCKSGADMPLPAVSDSVLQPLESKEELSQSKLHYNGRAALQTEAKGQIDGVLSQVELVIFRKDNCLYILTYTGVAEKFALDKGVFKNFIAEFKVP